MPLDEAPNLISLLMAVERTVIDELYRRLGEDGYDDLDPGSAVVFQHIRPGGSTPEELARLGQVTVASVEEQGRAMQAAGYVRRHDDGRIELNARGEAAVGAGMAVLADVERRWRDLLGEESFGAFAHALARLNLT